MIDKVSGQVEYAVMSTGGFLGVGESYSPVPWDSLVYDVNMGGYVMDTDRARLEKAPRFTSNAQPNWSDRYIRPLGRFEPGLDQTIEKVSVLA